MDNIYDYCENLLIDIKECRRYIESGEYLNGNIAVSYTHLDVYKRQVINL